MPRKKIVQPEENLNDNEKQNTLKVEIVSNWSLLEILSDWKKVLRIITALFFIVITILIGLAIVTISIKQIYPYNDIKINAFGATTMQNEDTDVIYWLFNTADLWANSGIQVKKGDVLTIRASGKSHTAIHHLVEDATKNKKLRDEWVGTDGKEKKDEGRDGLRAHYRIFKNKPQDALLMQVISDTIDIADPNINESYFVFDYLPPIPNEEKQKKVNYYFIGKERVDLLIHNDGILHFAVNDIVLTNNVIKSMEKANDKKIKEFQNAPEYKGKKDWNSLNEEKCFSFGKHPDGTLTQAKNEMTYYKDSSYHKAWFDDNVGSFLIVIERKRNK